MSSAVTNVMLIKAGSLCPPAQDDQTGLCLLIPPFDQTITNVRVIKSEHAPTSGDKFEGHRSF